MGIICIWKRGMTPEEAAPVIDASCQRPNANCDDDL
jgi:hypothetical protein